MNKLSVITFLDKPLDADNALVKSCRQQNLSLTVLSPEDTWVTNMTKFALLWDYLQQPELDDSRLLLIVDAFDVVITGSESQIIDKYDAFNTDIVFSAEANFYFRNKYLKYFYWKHYPRGDTPYHYLNSGSFIGKVIHIKQLLSSICNLYQVDPKNSKQLNKIRSDQYLYSRFFVDYYYKPHQVNFTLSLDNKHELLTCTGGRAFATENIPTHWIESFLFFRYQRHLLKMLNILDQQKYLPDVNYSNDRLENIVTNTQPLILHIPGSPEHFKHTLDLLLKNHPPPRYNLRQLTAQVISRFARIRSSMAVRHIHNINRDDASPQQIFRYLKNTNAKLQSSGEHLAECIEKKLPVSFAHFNDGEMTFIDKYLQGNHNNTWFGRRQNQYSKQLGNALLTALKYDSAHYFRGIPCSQCHPDLHSLANSILKNSNNVVPAMSLHHNLTLMPRLLLALQERDCWFVVNPRQNLDFYRHKGVKVYQKQTIVVPFRNSYLEYERLKNITFSEGAVVLMHCGMLGKIIMPEWISRNPNVSFITLGSSMDDLIQPSIKFGLYPSNIPFTRNKKGSKSFLFGRKKTCSECYPFD
jgi:hypothetical protein